MRAAVYINICLCSNPVGQGLLPLPSCLHCPQVMSSNVKWCRVMTTSKRVWLLSWLVQWHCTGHMLEAGDPRRAASTKSRHTSNWWERMLLLLPYSFEFKFDNWKQRTSYRVVVKQQPKLVAVHEQNMGVASWCQHEPELNQWIGTGSHWQTHELTYASWHQQIERSCDVEPAQV